MGDLYLVWIIEGFLINEREYANNIKSTSILYKFKGYETSLGKAGSWIVEGIIEALL